MLKGVVKNYRANLSHGFKGLGALVGNKYSNAAAVAKVLAHHERFVSNIDGFILEGHLAKLPCFASVAATEVVDRLKALVQLLHNPQTERRFAGAAKV
jgi:glutamate/tyrosine decarboxylase-like PLP-dependent enzyme